MFDAVVWPPLVVPVPVITTWAKPDDAIINKTESRIVFFIIEFIFNKRLFYLYIVDFLTTELHRVKYHGVTP
ncbi:hypothetical protein FACS1894169_14160 [Bacteroidia bacterium]|nr:hypothetical protein FACS1894169_14160 [Bacteroidia bacterium]